MSKFPVLNFSHVGLFTEDLDKMVDFYTRVLGFVITDQGELRGDRIVFMSLNPNEHHQIVVAEGRDDQCQSKVVHQLSFRVDGLADVQAVFRRARDEPNASEITPRCHGNAWSVYFKDPENNRIEVFTDSDWYIHQPCSEDFDLDRPVEDIYRDTEAFCRARPGFKPIQQWRDEVAAKMEAAIAARKA